MAICGTEPLSAVHDLDEFTCGKPSLDRWLKIRALSNQERGFTAVIVVHTANRVVGYYGLAQWRSCGRRCRAPFGPASRPILFLACCSGSLRRPRIGLARGLRRGCSSCRATMRYGRKPYRRSRADRQRRRPGSRRVLEATWFPGFERRSAHSIQDARRYRGIASLAISRLPKVHTSNRRALPFASR